ncbi:MAG TPA: nitronate monooxygenase [Deinococcales bacterium]|nr:nitronate monooxygenase [Deinococcales bacterium]
MDPQPGTWLTRRLGVRYPIVAAPMFLASNVALLRAVADAGAIGVIPSLNFRTTAELAAGLASLEDRPYGVNLILLNNPRLADDLAVCREARAPLVLTSLGDPAPVARQVREWGGCVVCDVTTQRHALKAAQAGAEALVAVTAGAGGHGGTASPLVLGPVIARETGLPVLLAGGVARGSAVTAALALGYAGVYAGTRFLATRESAAPDAHKQGIVAAGLEDIEFTPEVSGHPANFLHSSLNAFREARHNGTPVKAWRDVFSAGQAAALVGEVPAAAEVVATLMEEHARAVASMTAFSW